MMEWDNIIMWKWIRKNEWEEMDKIIRLEKFGERDGT